jgi:hypothetical protein
MDGNDNGRDGMNQERMDDPSFIAPREGAMDVDTAPQAPVGGSN